MIRVAIAQVNPTVGDFRGNLDKILEYVERAQVLDADVIVFPELVLCGYPPEDLLLKPAFINENLRQIRYLAGKVKGITAIVGFVDTDKYGIYNSSAIISGGKILGIYHKIHLPNYGVFDEKRYFREGKDIPLFRIKKSIFGVVICEDIWFPDSATNPVKRLSEKGARLIFVLNASPYYMNKIKDRELIVRRQAKRNQVFMVYANLVGGQDELVFDGQSFVVDSTGRLLARAGAFVQDLVVVDLKIRDISTASLCKVIDIKADLEKETRKVPIPKPFIPKVNILDEVYTALVTGLRDYVYKNNFKKVVVGLSGGIDSALTCVIACEALGRGRTVGVFMPSLYTSKESREDVKELVGRLGICMYTIEISHIFKRYLEELKEIFRGHPPDVTEENLQARIRGDILMAISNKFGYLVINTGNKSELSCGYCTLYGDMVGGFSVIKDVPKTLVYRLAEFVNKKENLIPENILKKPPSAELRPNQKDTDKLPPYELLDPILKAYIEEDKSIDEIVRSGFDIETVAKVARMVDFNEYKRRQAPPGIKITPKAFGKDRRMPITHRFIQKS